MGATNYWFTAPWLTAWAARPTSPSTLRWAAIVLSLTGIAGMVVLAMTRGPWLDEFFTIWMSGPALSLGTANSERWSTDLHPPFYYASVWALRHLVPDDLFALRMANAIPLTVVIPTILAWRARRRDDPWGAVFGGLMLGCPLFLAYFAELRSYFDVMAYAAALVVQLRILRWQDTDLSARDWRFGLLIACTIIFALNVHFVAAVAIAIPIGVEILHVLWERRWRSAALLVVPSILGTAALAVALAYLLTKTQPFSLFPAGPLTCLKYIAIAVLAGFALNPGVDLAIVSALLGRRQNSMRGIGWSAAGLAGAAAFLFAEGWFSNSMTLRYALVLIPPAAALAADIAAESVAANRLCVAAFLSCGVAMQAVTVAHEAVNKRWSTLAGDIAARARECPGTRVIAVDQGALLPREQVKPVSGTIGAFALGYNWVAARNGFAVTTTRNDADTPVTASSCPTLIWSEHDFGQIPDPLELAQQARIRFLWQNPRVGAERRLPVQRLIVILPARTP